MERMKLIREHIDEAFVRTPEDLSKLQNLNIGRLSLIKSWLEEHFIRKYEINDDFSIDIDDNINFQHIKIHGSLPEYIQFNVISGNLDACDCDLITLRGFPKMIKGYLWVEGNKLKSLKFCPEYVQQNVSFENNPLSSLENGPVTIGGLLYLKGTYIRSLKYLPIMNKKAYIVIDPNELFDGEYEKAKKLGYHFNWEERTFR